jgi:hypothetical protein
MVENMRRPVERQSMARQVGRRMYGVVVAVAVIGIAISGWCGGRRFARPTLLAFDLDLGVYSPGAVVERAIRLENSGWVPVRIYDVIPCCGTTLPQDFPKKVDARSQAVIVVRFQAPSSCVALRRKLTLKTNDYANPIREITLTGTPDDAICVSPPSVECGYIAESMKRDNAVTVTVARKGEQPWYVSTSAPYVSAILRQDRAKGCVFADIEVLPSAPRGSFSEYLYIRTGDVKTPNIIVPVIGVVERGLRLRPQQVYFGAVDGTTAVSRTITLEKIGAGWSSITSKPVPCKGVSLQLVDESKPTCKLVVTLDPTVAPANIREDITLQNGSGDSIRIPLIAAKQS